MTGTEMYVPNCGWLKNITHFSSDNHFSNVRRSSCYSSCSNRAIHDETVCLTSLAWRTKNLQNLRAPKNFGNSNIRTFGTLKFWKVEANMDNWDTGECKNENNRYFGNSRIRQPWNLTDSKIKESTKTKKLKNSKVGKYQNSVSSKVEKSGISRRFTNLQTRNFCNSKCTSTILQRVKKTIKKKIRK